MSFHSEIIWNSLSAKCYMIYRWALAHSQLHTTSFQQQQNSYGDQWAIFKWHLVLPSHRLFSWHSLRTLWQGQKTVLGASNLSVIFFFISHSPPEWHNTTQSNSWVYILHLILFCSLVDIQLTLLRKDMGNFSLNNNIFFLSKNKSIMQNGKKEKDRDFIINGDTLI